MTAASSAVQQVARLAGGWVSERCRTRVKAQVPVHLVLFHGPQIDLPLICYLCGRTGSHAHLPDIHTVCPTP